MKKIYVLFLIIAISFLLYFINSVVGNPLNQSLATSYAKHFLSTQFVDNDYSLESVGFNFDTKMYDYIVKRAEGSKEVAYTLTINSKIADRTVHNFAVHPSIVDEDLSTRLSKEATPHVTNVVRQLFPNASVEYRLSVPKGVLPSDTIWVPGFQLDYNASIFINYTVDEWDITKEDETLLELKEALLQNGVHFSRVSVRVTEEYEKNGITYMKIVLKRELYEHEE